MLNNVLPILKKYADFYNAATEEFRKKQEDIHAMYAEGFAIEEDKKASEEYSEKIMTTQKGCIEELKQNFDRVRLALLEATSLDVPEDFMKTYEVLKDISLSKSEFKSIAEKYKDNYIAVKLLKGLAEKNKIDDYIIIPLDDKIAEVDSLCTTCIDFVKKYQGVNESYQHENLLRGNIIDFVADFISSNVKAEEPTD